MGAWGVGPFDNDMASDLLADLREETFSFEDLQSLIGDEGYLELDGGQVAVALATLVRSMGLLHG